MAGSTAEGLYNNLMMDIMPSSAQLVDFGIDIAPDKDALLRAYQRGIRSGAITVEMLKEAFCDGPKLSKLVNMQVETIWDDLDRLDDEEWVEFDD
jgi:hypothetical protein